MYVKYESSEAWKRLNDALVEAGLPAQAVKESNGARWLLEDPVTIIVNLGIHAAPFASILIEHAPQLAIPNEIEMVARCMIQPKGFGEAMPWLLSLYRGYPRNQLIESHLFAVGLAIYAINDKRYYPEIIAICRERRYGGGRWALMGILPRARTDEAYELLVSSLDDLPVRRPAIEALGRFGRTAAISLIEQLNVDNDRRMCKTKETALRRLRRKISDNSTA